MLNPSGEIKPELIAQNDWRCYVCSQQEINEKSYQGLLRGAVAYCIYCGAKHKIVNTINGRTLMVIGVHI